jgi:hypothetical protein
MAEYGWPWQSHLSQGDDLLAAGSARAARSLYGQALSDLTDADPTSPTTALWRAVTQWRIGVTELVSGERAQAEAAFSTADELLWQVTSSAPTQRTRLYAREVLHQADELRDLLADSPSWLGTVQAVRCCEHGCASITVRCGFTGPHC